MPTWLLYGGGAVAALAAVWLFSNRAGGSDPSSDGSANSGDIGSMYMTGFGSNAVGSNSLPNGENSTLSIFQMIASAMKSKSDNDAMVLNNQTAATKDISLAALGNAYLHDVFANMGNMAKLGIASVGGMLGGQTQSATLTFSDPNKNIGLAHGFDAQGNLLAYGAGGKDVITKFVKGTFDKLDKSGK